MRRFRDKLVRRMLVTLVPAGVLPLLVFGGLALRSHYKSLRTAVDERRQAVAQMAVTELEARLSMHAEGIVAAAALIDDPKKDLASILEIFKSVSRAFVLNDRYEVTAEAGLALEKPYDFASLLALKSMRPGDVRFEFMVDSGPADDKVFVVHRPRDATYLVFEVALDAWMARVRALASAQPDTLVVLYQPGRGSSFIPLVETSNMDDALAILKGEASRLKSNTETVDLGDERFLMTFRGSSHKGLAVIIAEPWATALGPARQVLAVYVASTLVLALGLAFLVVMLARRTSRSLSGIADAAKALGAGQFDARAPEAGRDEVARLGSEFNRMTEALQESQLRTRVLYRSINELFVLSDVDAVLKKAVELPCTQCRADVAWFLPIRRGQEIAYADETVFIGLHGWMWKSHRTSAVSEADVASAWTSAPGDRVYKFMMKARGQEIGQLTIVYRNAPDETLESILHALVGLVESAMHKQEVIQRSAFVNTELEMAEAVQRNVLADNVLLRGEGRVAYHYEPASRLGGDWFYLFEDVANDKILVVMGDVTGQGLTQGLVTTAVKGALDVMKALARDMPGLLGLSPANVVTLLETVVRRVAGSNGLMMTCLAVEVDFDAMQLKICNAGHTFPIHVRPGNDGNEVSHLHKDQQPFLGASGDGVHVYKDTVYPMAQGDVLVLYSDGLSGAKSLKSPIFGRLLFRNLRERRQRVAADAFKDEIIAMFRYYTQGRRIEDDVCFLVIKADRSSRSRRGNVA